MFRFCGGIAKNEKQRWQKSMVRLSPAEVTTARADITEPEKQCWPKSMARLSLEGLTAARADIAENKKKTMAREYGKVESGRSCDDKGRCSRE